MDDNFKCIYKILKTLETAMDLDDINIDEIGYKHLEVSRSRWVKYIEMMADAGLIKGVSFKKYIDGTTNVINNRIRITLKGLEYLSENSIMQRIYKAASGAADIITAIKP